MILSDFLWFFSDLICVLIETTTKKEKKQLYYCLFGYYILVVMPVSMHADSETLYILLYIANYKLQIIYCKLYFMLFKSDNMC